MVILTFSLLLKTFLQHLEQLAFIIVTYYVRIPLLHLSQIHT